MASYEGIAEITDEGVKKHFRNREPFEALFELIWNGFDANSKTVKVVQNYNDVDGLESVEIVDEGDGVDLTSLDKSFKNFFESTKKNNDNKHGSQGIGRLSFHMLCADATWFTKRGGTDGRIDINASAIRKFKGEDIEPSAQHKYITRLKSGTCVVLRNFIASNKIPLKDELKRKLSKEFGWFLALNKEKSLILDGDKITIPSHDLYEDKKVIGDHPVHIRVIRWDERPSSEKSYNYLIKNNHEVIEKQLSKANNKVAFFTSAYAFSDILDTYDVDGLQMDPSHQETKRLVSQIYRKMTEFQRKIYDEYLVRHVDREIQRFDDKGYFPDYTGIPEEYARVRKANTKRLIKEIYISDPQVFNNVSKKPAKILIRLLDKILVSNENDSVFEVLEGVLDLSNESMKSLAEHLRTTTLENIVSTIEVLKKRQNAVHCLKEVMDNRFLEVLETPDLQKIIESNTWLFGPQYTTLGAEEDDFTRIAKNLRERITGVDEVTAQDIEQEKLVDGAKRQVDLFLARKTKTFDARGNSIFKCVILEIKRPSVSLNKKHLQQLDDYAEIISKHPSFNSDRMYFELVLIGRKISKDDFQIKHRKESLKHCAEYGLVSESPKMKCYVKDWFTIIDEFELNNTYLLENLNTRLESLSEQNTECLVQQLQQK